MLDCIMNISAGPDARFNKDLLKQVKGLGVYFSALRRKVVYAGRRIWRQSMLTLTACCAAVTVSLPSAAPYRRLRHSRLKDMDFGINECTIDGLDTCPEVVQIWMPTLSRTQSRKVDVLDSVADDTVVVKVGMLGDCETGKSSFMENYVGIKKRSDRYIPTAGMVSMQKIVALKNAKIIFSLSELSGYGQLEGLLPIVCQDAAALLFVFDLTRRSTLNSVKEWFLQARVHNKTAMPILIGAKYDQFVNFPDDIQFTIIQQAMHYAHTMGASLFFSSATHNINVQKIFKVITAKLFDLPCHISRNHTFGEPIIDY
ncbi:hypothetical protein O6H91_21G046200 [Diphasiastrum complanatum]|uniref:Uncharacterized protein n=2 Tax=Diphasiastrum complanatum TaxID=34168 RepID=A0ACC2ALC8_DIPCM|nr:hypothetical protein O6H91_21G046200 [Diphasiastrum complanatum]KAJ7517923.1 hypothetical protein O6H91_21G046200 [Diphasiastrum complanatum]